MVSRAKVRLLGAVVALAQAGCGATGYGAPPLFPESYPVPVGETYPVPVGPDGQPLPVEEVPPAAGPVAPADASVPTPTPTPSPE
jgi:hypothetical protein